MTGILLGMPNSWEHYWLFVLPALGWALYETWRRGDSRSWEAWLGIAAFLMIMKLTRLYGENSFGRFASGSQMAGLAMFWVWLVRRWLSGREVDEMAADRKINVQL